jgi:hypothetical protein
MTAPLSDSLREFADRPLTIAAIAYLERHGISVLNRGPALFRAAADELDLLYDEVHRLTAILAAQQGRIDVDRSEGSEND